MFNGKWSPLLWAILLGPALCPAARAGRFETFTAKAAQGPKLKVVAATYFGSDGIEEFIVAGALGDGTIAAFGNAWGPHFPAQPAPLVLGAGRHHQLDPYLPEPGQKKRILRADDPDCAGFIAFYGSDLQSLKKVVRFDWGVASLTAATVLPDGGGLLIAGRCTDAFAPAVRGAVQSETAPTEDASPPEEYAGAKVSGDVFIAKLPASGDGVLWATIFKGSRTPPTQLWLDYEGNVYADVSGLVRVRGDGRTVTHIDLVTQSAGEIKRRPLTAANTSRYLSIDPKDGSFYFGGDRNTRTGFQAWRQPYVYRYDREGRKLSTMWDWPPKQCACGGDGNGLCADSSPRVMDIAPDGTLVVAAWADGGNTVFTRQPGDLEKTAGLKGFGMDSSGMKGAGSLAYVMKIDPKTRRVADGSMFQAYTPMTASDPRRRGAPSSLKINRLRLAPDGSIAMTGTAATGLIQTPGAFYKPSDPTAGYGGEFVAVFSGDFQNLLFSSYLPGCENATIAPTPQGFIVVSRSRGDDGAATPTASPTTNAVQNEKRGDYDGHIILLSREK